MKNQKGITLIALVVTIVVLLILAGTSIAMLSGDNGIITQAQNANYANTEGEVVDKIRMAYNTVSAEVRVNTATDRGYNALNFDSMVELVQLIASDLGMGDITMPAEKNLTKLYEENTDLSDGAGYDILVKQDFTKIYVVYADNVFENTESIADEYTTSGATEPEEVTNGKYNRIIMTMTFSRGSNANDTVTLSEYVSQIN